MRHHAEWRHGNGVLFFWYLNTPLWTTPSRKYTKGGPKLTIGARPEGVASVGTSIKPHQRTPIIPAFHRIKGPRSLPPPFKPVSRRYFIVLVENLFAGPGHGTTMDAVDAARMGFVLMA